MIFLNTSFVQEEATASLMYEMEKDNYESIDHTDIERGEVLDSPQNSPQPAKQSHVAKVLPNHQKQHSSMSRNDDRICRTYREWHTISFVLQ